MRDFSEPASCIRSAVARPPKHLVFRLVFPTKATEAFCQCVQPVSSRSRAEFRELSPAREFSSSPFWSKCEVDCLKPLEGS